MAEFYEMPQASPTMVEGTLLAWHKKEGDALVSQDVIAEVATDKAAMEIEVFDPGILLKILADEGDVVPAGRPIAIIGKEAGEDIEALLAEYQTILEQVPEDTGAEAAEVADAAASTQAAPAARPAAPQTPPPAAGYTPPEWQGQALPSGICESPGVFSMESGAAVVRASPVARRVAQTEGVALEQVTGTGPGGRIMKEDVLGSAKGRAATSWRPGPDTAVAHSPMRKTIAARLKESWLDNPSFYLTACFDCDALVSLRARMKARNPEQRVSYNDILLRCVGQALVDVPEVNASWTNEAIVRHGRVDIGVAVALQDGLITPIIRDVPSKAVASIAEEVRTLAQRAKALNLSPEEYTGATFTVSNLGMMGIEEFTAIINPPAAAILAVGELKQEPIAKDGGIGLGWRMRVTMTCDHRVIDGALGARFLLALRDYVESPGLLAMQ